MTRLSDIKRWTCVMTFIVCFILHGLSAVYDVKRILLINTMVKFRATNTGNNFCMKVGDTIYVLVYITRLCPGKQNTVSWLVCLFRFKLFHNVGYKFLGLSLSSFNVNLKHGGSVYLSNLSGFPSTSTRSCTT